MSQLIQFDQLRLPDAAQQLRRQVRQFLSDEVSRGTFDPRRGALQAGYDPAFSRRWERVFPATGSTCICQIAGGSLLGSVRKNDRPSGPHSTRIEEAKGGTSTRVSGTLKMEILPTPSAGNVCTLGFQSGPSP